MTVLVISTDEMDKYKAFFEGMGLAFVEEKHGEGPVHFASEVNGHVLEIYPNGGVGGKTNVRFHGK